MADKVIFAEQTVEFEVSDGFGFIQYNGNPPFTLEAGKTYRVVWDGTEYTCTAEAQETGLEEIVSIVMGNLTGETDYPPFQISYVYNASGATESESVSIISIDAEASHTVAIYEVAEGGSDDPGSGETYADSDVSILNYSQNPVTYENVPKVWLTHPSSTEENPVRVPFTYGEAVSKTVQPNFATGDMAVPITAGELVTELTIAKPEELKPENIAEGEYIAGVGPGTHVGSGSNQSKEIIKIPFISYATAKNDLTYTATGDKSVSVSTTIPSDALLFDVLCGGGLNSSSSSIQGYAIPTLGRNAYTKTVGESAITLSYTYNAYVSRAYKNLIAAIYAAYVIPGVYLEIEDEVATLWFDKTVTSYSVGQVPSATPFSVADLSACGVTSLPAYMFNGHTSLNAVHLPITLTTINSYAFNGCANLTQINLPEALTFIGSSAFQNCSNLTEIVLPDGLGIINSSVFSGCAKLESITIPESVTSIGYGSFIGCKSIAEITVPSKVTSIGMSAFSGCTALKDVILSEGLTTINSNAFQTCTALTEIAIPSTVTTMAGYVFYGCTALQTVDFSSHTSVPTLSGTYAFQNCPSTLQIKVPAALYDEWIAATNWSTYANYIVAV